MKFQGAVVLVTGSNRGLGLGLVRACLAAGARRIYAGARDPRSLDSLVRENAGRVTALALDITDPESLARAAADAPDVSVLINNAGVLASFNVLTSSPAQLAQDLAVNFFGMVAASKAFLPALSRAGDRGGAALVNVLSVVSLASMPALGGYSAAKAAAFSVTQALRGDLAKRKISVHAALPGAIDTDMVRAMDMKKTSPEVVAAGIVQGVELGLDEITPDPMSRELFLLWRSDPKQLELRLASMSG